MGGGDSQSGGADDMAGMLGSLLGGGGGAQDTSPDAGDLLGSLMGGDGGGGGGGLLGGLLGGLMGGGGNAGQMSFGGGGGGSLPFAGTLAEKLGISEQMANMLIMGAIAFTQALGQGGGSTVSHVAHLGGMVAGYWYLKTPVRRPPQKRPGPPKPPNPAQLRRVH